MKKNAKDVHAVNADFIADWTGNNKNCVLSVDIQADSDLQASSSCGGSDQGWLEINEDHLYRAYDGGSYLFGGDGGGSDEWAIVKTEPTVLSNVQYGVPGDSANWTMKLEFKTNYIGAEGEVTFYAYR